MIVHLCFLQLLYKMKQYTIFYFNIWCRKKLHTAIPLGITNKASCMCDKSGHTEKFMTTDTPVKPQCIEFCSNKS